MIYSEVLLRLKCLIIKFKLTLDYSFKNWSVLSPLSDFNPSILKVYLPF